jgi:four helix bundle protein
MPSTTARRGAASFEELKIWQDARLLMNRVFRITQNAAFSRNFAVKDQIQRAAVSVMSNIAEGFERGSRPDFARFLYIAKASCGEVRSLSYAALDIGLIAELEHQEIVQRCVELGRQTGGLIRHLEKPAAK